MGLIEENNLTKSNGQLVIFLSKQIVSNDSKNECF